MTSKIARWCRSIESRDRQISRLVFIRNTNIILFISLSIAVASSTSCLRTDDSLSESRYDMVDKAGCRILVFYVTQRQRIRLGSHVDVMVDGVKVGDGLVVRLMYDDADPDDLGIHMIIRVSSDMPISSDLEAWTGGHLVGIYTWNRRGYDMNTQ